MAQDELAGRRPLGARGGVAAPAARATGAARAGAGPGLRGVRRRCLRLRLAVHVRGAGAAAPLPRALARARARRRVPARARACVLAPRGARRRRRGDAAPRGPSAGNDVLSRVVLPRCESIISVNFVSV